VAIAQEIVVKVTLDDSRAQKGLSNLDKLVNKADKGFSGLSKSLVAIGAAAAVGAIVKVSKATLDLASALEESENAINVVFGDAVGIIRDFGEDSVNSVGLATASFNELTIATGSLLKNAGLPLDEVAEKTIELTQRSADLASVFNTDVQEATLALGAALRGETEPARRFGVTLNDAAVQNEALASGLASTKAEITEAVKIQARYNLILRQSEQVAGDFANTQESFSNQSKIAGENIKELGAAVGNILLPSASRFLSVALNPLLEGFTDWISKTTAIVRGTRELGKSIDELTISGVENRIAALTDQYEKLGEELENTTLLYKEAEPGAELDFWQNRLVEVSKEQNAVNEQLEEAKTKLQNLKAEAEEGFTPIAPDAPAITNEVANNLAKIAEINSELIAQGRFLEIQEQKALEDARMLNELLAERNAKQEEFVNATIRSTQVTAEFGSVFSDSFSAVGEALVTGENAAVSFAKALAESGKNAVATLLEATGQFLAVKAIEALVVKDFAGAALAGTGSALAFTAAGAVRALPVPELAEGGIVPATPGGRIVKVAEAGQAEAIVPLDKAGFGGQTVVIVNNNNTNIAGSIWQEEALANAVSSQQRRQKRGF
jgi:hypothetical protein